MAPVIVWRSAVGVAGFLIALGEPVVFLAGDGCGVRLISAVPS